jgi:hypothetical protein
MNGNQDTQSNLVDTTDCLEAVGVCRCWKNFLAVVIILCLLLLQMSFWLVNTGYVKAEAIETSLSETASGPLLSEESDADVSVIESDTIKKAAEKAVAVEPTETKKEIKKSRQRLFGVKMEHLSWVIRFCNFILILAAVLYCLTLLFCLKISLIGRLGGINHICRAFFISLVMVVLLLPWQKYFSHIVMGAIYTPGELVKWCTAENGSIFDTVIHYLRFTGYWLLILLLLIFSLIRSSRWTKSILRRLEVL